MKRNIPITKPCFDESYRLGILKLAEEVEIKGVVHVTGGGLIDNVPRILPGNADATIDMTSWHPHSIFKIIQDMGEIEQVEMFKTFNMGIGMAVIVGLKDHRQAIHTLGLIGYRANRIGEIHEGTGGICVTC